MHGMSQILKSVILSVISVKSVVNQWTPVFYFLLNNCSAGHPISLCLQYLQVRLPRIKLFPVVDNTTISIAANNKMKLNLMIIITIAVRRGIRETSRSGIISFHVKLFSQNFDGSPFLKNRELSLPLPKPQVLPQ